MISPGLNEQQAVTYETLAGNVHIITFKEASRDAVDAYINAMDDIYRDVTMDDTVCILVDYRESGFPPMNYLVRRGVAWANSLSIHPTARLAVVHRPDFAVSLFGSLVQMYRFGYLSTHFFEGDAGYDDALDWLRF